MLTGPEVTSKLSQKFLSIKEEQDRVPVTFSWVLQQRWSCKILARESVLDKRKARIRPANAEEGILHVIKDGCDHESMKQEMCWSPMSGINTEWFLSHLPQTLHTSEKSPMCGRCVQFRWWLRCLGEPDWVSGFCLCPALAWNVVDSSETKQQAEDSLSLTPSRIHTHTFTCNMKK